MHAATPAEMQPGLEMRAADASDLPTLIDITSRAYRDDPLIGYFVRTDARRPDGLHRLFDFCLREQALVHGQATMTVDGTACAAWIPPEQATLGLPLGAQIRLLPRMARVCMLARVPKLLAAMSLMERHHPRSPSHYYLYLLAVVPEHQGQGVGTAVLQAGLRMIDRARAATYLETANERNLPFYERHGFAITGQARLPFRGPKVWSLWREPRSATLP